MKFKNTKKQGDYGLGVAIAYFTKLEITVALPLTDSQDYDLVVDLNGLKKVQVKTCLTLPNKYKTIEIDLRLIGGRTGEVVQKYANELEYDLLFVITELGCYLIPKDKFKENSSSITVGKKYQEYKVG